MEIKIKSDTITPALKKLYKNSGPVARRQALSRIGNGLANRIREQMSKEQQYDGKPMKSPARKTKFGGRFSKDYNYRYRDGFRHLTSSERAEYRASGKVGGGAGRKTESRAKGVKVRRRIPVTPESKQLQDSGRTIGSIQLLTADANRVRVGPTNDHGNFIISVHNATRKPFGISKKAADEAAEIAIKSLMKGV